MLLNNKTEIPTERLPVHIGFIMDGNGRWAKKRGLPRNFGHREGAATFKKIVDYCKKIGIKYITFYAFSTENWSRPKEEVDGIMNLFNEYLDDVRSHIDKKTRVIFLGDKTPINEVCRRKMISLEEDSAKFDEMTLLIAMNYGGRDEIVHAAKEIGRKIESGELSAEDISEEMIASHLYTAGIPDVDLIIRPSGELRLSNFLTWQSAYAELYFTDILWPDFTPKELDRALIDYSSRNRRFGGV